MARRKSRKQSVVETIMSRVHLSKKEKKQIIKRVETLREEIQQMREQMREISADPTIYLRRYSANFHSLYKTDEYIHSLVKRRHSIPL